MIGYDWLKNRDWQKERLAHDALDAAIELNNACIGGKELRYDALNKVIEELDRISQYPNGSGVSDFTLIFHFLENIGIKNLNKVQEVKQEIEYIIIRLRKIRDMFDGFQPMDRSEVCYMQDVLNILYWRAQAESFILK